MASTELGCMPTSWVFLFLLCFTTLWKMNVHVASFTFFLPVLDSMMDKFPFSLF